MALVGAKIDHPLKVKIVELQDRTNSLFEKLVGPLPTDAVVLSGGCALNGIGSYELLRRGTKKYLHVGPSVNDGGLVVGDALFALHAVAGFPRVYYAPGTVAFSGWDAGVELMSRETAYKVAELVAAGKVVGVFQGRAESGPRALGHRSILSDPTRPEMKDRINTLKKRLPYRPVAPVMTKEFAKEHFDLIDPEAYYFMTCIAQSRESARSLIPSGLHEDGSARIQVAIPESGLEDVIAGLQDLGRPPCVLNTSFNDSGKSIVHTVDQAVEVGTKIGLDAIAVGNDLRILR
jgi:carbamoyltransferase